jgi:hypothetical protein
MQVLNANKPYRTTECQTPTYPVLCRLQMHRRGVVMRLSTSPTIPQLCDLEYRRGDPASQRTLRSKERNVMPDLSPLHTLWQIITLFLRSDWFLAGPFGITVIGPAPFASGKDGDGPRQLREKEEGEGV